MWCEVYKGSRYPDAYLYLNRGDSPDSVPDELLEKMGTLEKVMVIDLDKRQSLAQVNIQNVRASLADPGYYLQLPPNKHVLAYGEGLRDR